MEAGVDEMGNNPRLPQGGVIRTAPNHSVLLGGSGIPDILFYKSVIYN